MLLRADLGARLTTHLGQTFIALAAGYLLRASVENGVMEPIAGVWLGLMYAVGWLAISSALHRRGNHLGATFASTLALVLALPLIVEAAWRFHLWTANVAFVVLAAVAASSLALTISSRQQGSAWFTVISIASAAFVLMAAMRAYWSAGLFFLAFGAAVFAIAYIGGTPSLRWPGALLADAAALSIAPHVLLAIAIVVYPVLVLTRSLLLHHSIQAFETAQSAALLVVGGIVVFDGDALALFWTSSAVVLGAAAAWGRQRLLLTYAVVLGLAAAGASGLLAYSTRALIAPEMPSPVLPLSGLAVLALLCALGFLAAQSADPRELGDVAIALSVTTLFLWCAAGLASGAANQALGGRPAVSTIALACSASIAAAASSLRSFASVRWVVYPFLVIVGVKLLVQMVRGQDPTALFLALAAYGAALMLTARR